MDQIVLDLGPDGNAGIGDVAVVFGDGRDGGPTATDWADVAGTIDYEIVTRIGARVPRLYVGSAVRSASGPAAEPAERSVEGAVGTTEGGQP
jgi:alanine racemase